MLQIAASRFRDCLQLDDMSAHRNSKENIMSDIETEKKKNAYLANWLSNASVALGFSGVATIGISNIFTPVADNCTLAIYVVVLGLLAIGFYAVGLRAAKKS